MSSQFSVDPDVALAGFKAVGGADVVQASAGHVVPGRGVRTGHDPGRTQGNSVHLSDRVKNILQFYNKRKLQTISSGVNLKSLI